MRDQAGGRKASPRTGFRDTCWLTLREGGERESDDNK
jgi:hypothetical protein